MFPLNGKIEAVNHRLKRLKTFSVKRFLSSVLALVVGISVLSGELHAHSVAQVQTTKYFAPETVDLITSRAAAGQPGLVVGDTVNYIVQFTPVANGSNIGVQGYVTDYIPPGTEVVGAWIVNKDGLGNFYEISPSLPAPSYDGWGRSGFGGGGGSTFAAPFDTYAYDATGLCAAGLFTNNCNARQCEVNADTGIFYSTDPRTDVFPSSSTRVVQGTAGNGYTITPQRQNQLNPIIGQAVVTTHNLWDADQTNAFGSNALPAAAPMSMAPIVRLTASNTPFNAGSPVAGPQTGYQLDNTGGIGPWKRIYYPGSRMGDQSRGPAINGGYVGATAAASDPGAVCGFSTSAGRVVSPANPLPAGTNAVRWALGKLQVGEIKYVKLSLRLTAPVPADGVLNSSEVFGSDTANADPSTVITVGDNTWMYHVPSVADNNSSMFVLKKVIGYYDPAAPAVLVPSDGTYIPAASKVRYRLTYVNSGTIPQSNVTLSDTLPCQTGANAATNFVNLGGPITVPAAFAPVTAAGNCGTIPQTRSTFSFPVLPTLVPGASGSIEFDVQTTAINGDIVSNTGVLSSTAYPTGVITNAVSNVNGAPNLIIQKSTSTPSAAAGGTATYTITVTNNGTMADSNVVVYDLLPASSDIYSATTRFSYAATTAVTGMVAVVPSVSIAATNLTGTVTVNNGATAVTGTGTLFLTELAINDYIYINNVRYLVAAIASNTALTLAIPHVGNVAGVPYTKTPAPYNTQPNATNQEMVIWNFAGQPLAAGASFSITFTANVGASVASASTPYTNDAVVVYAGGIGRSEITDAAGVSVTSPLSVTKSIDCFFSGGVCVPFTGNLPANGKVRYRIDYSNNGTTTINNTVLIDTLPCQATVAPVSYNGAANSVGILSGPITSPSAASLSALAAGVCTAPATRQSFSFPAATLNAGQTGTIKYDVQTNAADGNIVTNDVSLSGTAVSTATDQVQASVVSQPSLSIVKSASASAIAAGNSLTYTLTVTNDGTGSASNIVIYDWLPSDGAVANVATRFSYVNASSSVSGVLTAVTPSVTMPPVVAPFNADPYAANMQELAWNFGTQILAPGDSFTIVFSASAGASMTTGTSYNNNARATWTGSSANSAAVPVTLAAQIADLAVSKTDGVTSVLSGGTTSYSVTLTNNGPNAANNSLLRDAAVTGLTKTGLMCVAVGGAVCPTLDIPTLEGTGLTIATLPNGGSITLTVNANVTAAPGATVTNSATAYLPAGFSEGNWSNNTASDIDDVVAVIAPDLSTSTKTWVNLSGGSPANGSVIEYTVTLIESAGADAYSVTVEDIVPANVSSFTMTSIPAGATDNSTAAPTGANGTGYLNVSNITVPANGTVTLKFTVAIAATAGTAIDNMATITVPGGTGGSPTAPTINVLGPNLSTSTKTWVDLNGGDQMPGDTIRYTITIIESDGVATTASVTDDLPLNVTGFVPGSMTVPAGAVNSSTAAPTGANTNGYVNVTGINIPAFGTETVVFEVAIAAGAATGTVIDNTATVTPASGTSGTATAPTITVAGSTIPGTGNKPLYPDSLTGMSRIQPVANAASFAAIPRGGTIWTWTLAPALAKPVTIDPALSLSVPVELWLATNANRTFTNVPVTLSCGVTAVGTFTQPTMALTTAPTKWIFNIPLAAVTTCTAGSAWTLQMTNTQAAGGALRDIRVYPSPTVGNFSQVILPSQNVINVDSVDVYSAVYPGTTKLPIYTNGDTVYLRSVVSDPFGAFDISSVTVTVKDANGAVVVNNAAMASVILPANPYATTDTFEYAYTLPVSTASGTWTVEITANEGSEGTVTDLGIATFNTTFGPYGGMSGTVFHDLNGDGSKQAGEPGMAAVVVDLYSSIGVFVDSYATDASGNYQFSNLTVGSYTVRVNNPPAGYSATVTQPLAVTVAANTVSAGNNLGYGLNGSISGIAYNDVNGDGVKQAGEPVFANVVVSRYTVGDVLIDSYTTDASGQYIFKNINSGSYHLRAVAPTGFGATTTQPLTATATVGVTNSGNNFGFQAYAQVSGKIFADVNGNGGAFELGTDSWLQGATVYLKQGATVVATASTSSGGVYAFSVLIGNNPGGVTYTIDVDQAAAPISGVAKTVGTDPYSLTMTVGSNQSVADIGYHVQNTSISGTVYDDINASATFDGVPVDAVVPSATVNLYDASATLIQTVASNGSGYYEFTGLISGTYKVEVIVPVGYQAVSPSAVPPANPSQVVTAAIGMPLTSINFGLSSAVGNGNKPLYLTNLATLTRTMPAAPAPAVGTNIMRGASASWIETPVLQLPVTIDPALSSTVPVQLYLDTTSTHQYDIQVDLYCSTTPTVKLTQTLIQQQLTIGMVTPLTFNLPLNAPMTCAAGGAWTLSVSNLGGLGNGRDLIVMPMDPVILAPSSATLPSQNVIKVEAIDAYSAAYPAVTQPVAGYMPGNWVYARAVVSDPFGSFDIYSATVTITDPLGTSVVGPAAVYPMVNDSLLATKTFEIAYQLPAGANTGLWSISVTANEGLEGTISDTSTGTFQVGVLPNLSTSTKSVVDVNGGEANPGDVLRYTITLNETGGQVSSNVTVTDHIPANVVGFSVVSVPAGATDNSTVSGGTNGTGYLDVTGITVPANGSASIVFDVIISGGATPGTLINNAANVTPTTGIGAAPGAPTVIVSPSSVPNTGNKPLYLTNLAGLTRTLPAGPAPAVGTNIMRGASASWIETPPLQLPVTIDPALNSTVPVQLYLDTTSNRQYDIQVDFYCSLTPTNKLTQTLLQQQLTIGMITPLTFNLPLNAPMTCAAGGAWTLSVSNLGGLRNGRDIIVMPMDPVSLVSSNVILPSQNVIQVEAVDAYSAAYPAVTQPAAGFLPGDWVFARAVVSDPFGSFDIYSATVTISDPVGTTVVGPAAVYPMVNDSLLATKTFEIAYQLPAGASTGLWSISVTANEGLEGMISDTTIGTFQVGVLPNLSTSTKSVVDVNGGEANPGDVLRYTISLNETGGQTATNVHVIDNMPANVVAFSVTSTPAGSTDNSTLAGGTNGTGYLDVTGITVPANGSAIIVFDVVIAAGTAPGTLIDNAANVIPAVGIGGAPAAPTVVVSPSNVSSTGNKPLYLTNLASLTRTRPAGPALAAGTNIMRGASASWVEAPVLQLPVTIDPAISSNVPVQLYLDTTNTRQYDIQVDLYCSTAPGTRISQTLLQQQLTMGVVSPMLFNLPLISPMTCNAGGTWILSVSNLGGLRNGRDIIVMPMDAVSLTPASVTLPSQNVIAVDAVDVYSAAYPAATQPATGFIPGDWVYARAVVSDPFGSFDIYSASVTITDSLSATVVGPAAVYPMVNDSLLATKTFEVAYQVPGGAPTGLWSVNVTANEGLEGTVSDTAVGTFQVGALPNLSTSTKTVVDVNGADADPGDVLRYTITLNETGGQNSNNVHVIDNIPANVVNFTMVSIPAGAVDNSTSSGGSNGTGYLDITGINVPANGSVSIVFEVTVTPLISPGAVIDNAATIIPSLGIGGTPVAPTIIVSASAIAGTGNKALYFNGLTTSRTQPPAAPVPAGTPVAQGSVVSFVQTPVLQMPVTIDPTAGSGFVPVQLYLDTTSTRAYDVKVDLYCSLTPATKFTQTLLQQQLTIGAVTAVTFNLPLTAAHTCAVGGAWTVDVTNVGGVRAGRDIVVMPVGPGVGAFSNVSLPSLNVINVDVTDAYSAAYPASTKPLTSRYMVGDWVYTRAVVSDPFGSFDIYSVTIDITDANATPMITGALMTMVLDSGLATKTFEYAYQVPATTAFGSWTYAITANEGVEGTVTNTSFGAFTVATAALPSLTVLKQANVGTALPGSVIIYTVNTSNTGAGIAANVVVTDHLSQFTSLATDPWGNGTPFKFVEGANPSGLTIGAITYSDNNGTTYAYPLNVGLMYDPNVTNFKVQMSGSMNANQAANPSFILQYKVQVK